MPCQNNGCKSKQVKDRGRGVLMCDPCYDSLPEEVDHDSDDDTSDGGGNGAALGPRLVPNELLTYAFTYVDSSSPDMLIDTIEKFYSEDDVREAKDLLWREYKDILPAPVSRRRGSVRTAVKATAQDIILDGVVAIRNSGKTNNVTFCAVNVKKLPKFNPEEINLQSIVNRLASVELQMRNVQENLGASVARVTVLEDGKATSSEGRRSFAAVTQVAESSLPVRKVIPGSATPYLGGPHNIGNVNRGSQIHGSGAAAASTDTATAAPQAGQPRSANVNEAQWQQQRDERRRRIREAVKTSNVIVGTRTGANLQCGYDVRNVFISNVNQRFTDSDIKEYMKAIGKECLKIKQISHENATNKSFKVCVKHADIAAVMDPDFWGEGIKCREWLR